MALVSRRVIPLRRPRRGLRRWSRFIGLLKWKEFLIIIFYTSMTMFALGGAIFFGVRSVQGYRKGLIFFYLTMLLFMSACLLICHMLLIKWRLDRFFEDFARSKPPGVLGSLSIEREPASSFAAVAEAADTASISAQQSNSSTFISRLKAVLKLFHAYAVFLAALVISLLVLFDIATGYTASHFRPTLASVIGITALQCWVVAVSFAWFINVLVFNDAAGPEEEELFANLPVAESLQQAYNVRMSSSSGTGKSSGKSSGRHHNSGAGEWMTGRGGRHVSRDERGKVVASKPQFQRRSKAESGAKPESTMWDLPTSDISTCALATIRGVSSQWGDIDEADAGKAGGADAADTTSARLQLQREFEGIRIQPTVIGVPSFTVASMPTMSPELRSPV